MGFRGIDRVESIWMVSEASLMADAGLIVIVTFISPTQMDGKLADSRFAVDEFLKICVDTPLYEC